MRLKFIVPLLALLAAAYVAIEVVRTLRALDLVERERDGWQQPAAILEPLHLRAGMTVVDLGSGAGYFALKMAPMVRPGGQVLAVDLRRESLAFLWLRAWRHGDREVRVIVGAPDDPRLPAVSVDAVLIANTYHEIADPGPVIDRLSAAMRPGARLVIADRRPRAGGGGRGEGERHGIHPDVVTRQVSPHRLRPVAREDAVIDRAGDDEVWWLLVFEKAPDEG